ncbi:MAG: hypothetical protein ABIA76_02540 [Candidatus Diapherotrites archaeon]
MERKFYLDTAIWRDYFEDRSDGLRPLGEFAFQFLKKCWMRNWIVLVSSEVEKELLAYYSRKQVNEIFSEFKDVIVNVCLFKEQVSEAIAFWVKKGKAFPFSDVLHSVIARDCSTVLVCRDRHFWEINLVECAFPEEID